MRLTVLAIINILMIIIGIITISVSVGYLPSTGGTVPQEMTLEQYQAQQHTALLNSTGFKWVIVGCCITGTGILMALIRIYRDNQREIARYNNTVLPLQVKRPEPLAKPLAEPLAEPLAKPLAEPLAKPLAEPLAKPLAEPLAKPLVIQEAKSTNSIVKYPTNAPRGPIIYHEPMPYRVNIPESRWQIHAPPRPILKVKRGPIVEII